MNKKLFSLRNVNTGKRQGEFSSKNAAKAERRKLNPSKDGKEIIEWVVTLASDHHRFKPIGSSKGYATSRVYVVHTKIREQNRALRRAA